jgi:superfamily I DNA/RNA helicase
MNNLGIPFTFPDDWDGWSRDDKDEYFESHYYSNLDLFAGHESNIQSYPAVFIDEFQDYKEEWARIIKRYFLGGQGLESDGELVIFGDWGQDIYGRSSNNFEVTPIPGRWNELDTPHRQQNPKVKALNITYQQKYFADRYEPRPEDQELTLFGSMDAEEHIRYRFRNQYDTDWIVSSIVDDMIELDIHPNDACIMGFSVGRIRSLDYSYRRKTREKTTSMCETVEFYNKLKHDCQRRAQRAKQDRNVSWSEMKSIKQRCLHELTRRIRKNKKWNFWMNAGTAKFSTIHSFKGWEAHTLFLVIEDDIMENERRELIYTGFTRCKNNLVIFNIGDADFDGFISNHAADLGIDTLT